MDSRIDSSLTPEERIVLAAYAAPPVSEMIRAMRLSLMYALGAAAFLTVCIWSWQPLWALAVYAVLILFIMVRLLNAWHNAHHMPEIIAKYEARIRELESGESDAG